MGLPFLGNCLTLLAVLPSFGAGFATQTQKFSSVYSLLSQRVSMHIEPGIAQGAKLLLGFGTAPVPGISGSVWTKYSTWQDNLHQSFGILFL